MKVMINGKLENLTGVEAQLYKLHGEKAVLNRRGYLNQSKDFLSSAYKEKRTSEYTPRNTSDTTKPTGILEDDYE